MTDDARPTHSEDVERGVELLALGGETELSLAEAIDRIETVTTHPPTTRKILDEAKARDIIERENHTIKLQPTARDAADFESKIVRKDGDFSCERCGKGISTGHFLALDAGEHGPFGPECIKKVTGRE